MSPFAWLSKRCCSPQRCKIRDSLTNPRRHRHQAAASHDAYSRSIPLLSHNRLRFHESTVNSRLTHDDWTRCISKVSRLTHNYHKKFTVSYREASLLLAGWGKKELRAPMKVWVPPSKLNCAKKTQNFGKSATNCVKRTEGAKKNSYSFSRIRNQLNLSSDRQTILMTLQI